MHRTVYVDGYEGEGHGCAWTMSGIKRESNTCGLCLDPDCKRPLCSKTFMDGMWYLELGTTTRYADVKGRTSTKNPGHKTRRNIIAFVDKCAVVHLGDVTPHEKANAPAFLVFDRKHIHRVIDELHNVRNSIYADRYDSISVLGQNYPVRAQWCKKPGSSQSTLFHRWLLGLTGSSDEHRFEYVEHLNDIALDCREINLRTANTLHGNNLHMNRLKRAFWDEGVAGAARKADEINRSQEPYWNIVRLLPPLPDFVFAFKRVKRPRDLPRKLETLQAAGCSSKEQ